MVHKAQKWPLASVAALGAIPNGSMKDPFSHTPFLSLDGQPQDWECRIKGVERRGPQPFAPPRLSKTGDADGGPQAVWEQMADLRPPSAPQD